MPNDDIHDLRVIRGVSDTTGFDRNVRTDDGGHLIVTTTGTGPVTRADAFRYGTVSIAPSASATVVTFVTTGTTTVVMGFIATAGGDGRYELDVDGSPVAAARVNVAQPFIAAAIPNGGIPLAAGHTVTLTASADTNPGSATFEGTVFNG
jgi:hypothetical protein